MNRTRSGPINKMKSFSIKGFNFQIPFKLETLDRKMRFLEGYYPECNTIKEMGEAMREKHRHKKLFEKQGDLEDLAKDNFSNK